MTIETANRLFELRKKHNLSQEELAEKLGVSRQAVSKWERSEASPDTDNLIALAKIYGLSLDELIYGQKESAKEDANAEPRSNTKEYDDDTLYLNIEDGKDRVKIGPKGIFVENEDGDKVKISLSGIKIESSKIGNDGDEGDDEDEENYEKHGISIGKDGHIKIDVHESETKKTKFWLEVPYPIICVIAYLLFGFYNVCGGWALSWVIFVTIPIYYSFIEAIYKRRFSEFAYPVFATFVYLVCGLYFGNWHPSWVVFLTIPAYYPIAEALDKKLAKYRESKDM